MQILNETDIEIPVTSAYLSVACLDFKTDLSQNKLFHVGSVEIMGN
jgi:hypothetical protein